MNEIFQSFADEYHLYLDKMVNKCAKIFMVLKLGVVAVEYLVQIPKENISIDIGIGQPETTTIHSKACRK